MSTATAALLIPPDAGVRDRDGGRLLLTWQRFRANDCLATKEITALAIAPVLCHSVIATAGTSANASLLVLQCTQHLADAHTLVLRAQYSAVIAISRAEPGSHSRDA